MNFIKIKETCLYVHDLEKTKKFYHEVLGLEIINYEEGKHIFFRLGSSVLLCFNPEDSKTKKTPPPHYGGGKQHVAFEVKKSDYNYAKAEITSKGIAIIDEVIWKSGETSFYFEDLEGNVLEILPDKGIWD
ncbi:VOC family protein [Chryseolinea sp. H1M3-3]|uniref:VOC family protein n=1 Tax=Chryseolinea sp. H1M3-3 TaxID=3034144 RepID=UPI0023EBB50C|nr:VOC family protein [Chryseolinea sp. H1M3-3]